MADNFFSFSLCLLIYISIIVLAPKPRIFSHTQRWMWNYIHITCSHYYYYHFINIKIISVCAVVHEDNIAVGDVRVCLLILLLLHISSIREKNSKKDKQRKMLRISVFAVSLCSQKSWSNAWVFCDSLHTSHTRPAITKNPKGRMNISRLVSASSALHLISTRSFSVAFRVVVVVAAHVLSYP